MEIGIGSWHRVGVGVMAGVGDGTEWFRESIGACV
jgi:hypothetical protein